MSLIIQVQDLSKRFIISHEGRESYTALRDVVTHKTKRFFSFFNESYSKMRPGKEDFWALKDVNFEINQGDRVGIIGRNGAGKSTLLKILSRITEPTSGNIKIKGRTASLLEVGTGFHPELTGRENIFLNGAILGMSSQEIKKHFDAIVAFAEIEKFLDTPVKRYSSGMYVRLAFAVAAHLEPEILIVDEVLAVGDAQFQKKCLGKMEDVSNKQGRTVLFVSHNTAALLSLCNKGIVLNKGQVTHDADIVSAVSVYNALSIRQQHQVSVSTNLIIDEIRILNNDVWSLGDVTFSIRLSANESAELIKTIALIVYKGGKRIGVLDLRNQLNFLSIEMGSSVKFETTIESLPLVEGEYDLSMYIESTSGAGDFNDLFKFSVLPVAQPEHSYVPFDLSVRGDVQFNYHTSVIK